MSGFPFIFALIIILCACAGIVFLQIFLSKKESKWAGLILPILSCGISILAVLGMVLLSFMLTQRLVVDGGEVVEQVEQVGEVGDIASLIFPATYLFLLCNIPTGVFLAIYAACKGKRSRQRALDKMSVQDLE